jgi:5-methylcytosine-specific restriction endonuclease McrBC regulatory subunit McrC
MSNKQLEFYFKDYTSYVELKEGRDGHGSIIEQESPEFRAFEIAVKEKIKPSKLMANVTETGFKDEDKLTLIEFETFSSKSLFETKGLVGVLKVKDVIVGMENGDSHVFDVKITITSRFDQVNPYFLSYMLSYENPNFSDDFFTESSEESLFAILLLYLFKKQLQEAYRQGIFKTYQRKEKNDNRVKGAINVARHIQENMIFNGKIVYNSKENTVDNTLNHLILHTYDYLKSRFPDLTVRHIDRDNEIRIIIRTLKEATPSYINTNRNKVLMKSMTPLSHPYFTKYEVLRKTCIKILRNLGVSVFEGKEEVVNGLLYYIPDLWENFLLHNYKNYFLREDFVVHTENKIKIFKGDDRGSYRKLIRPDFVFFRKEQSPFFILDAKFKPRWYDVAANGRTLNPVYDDYLQVINYMVSYNTEAAGVIFPTNNGEILNNEFHISPYNTKSKFYCFEVVVPVGDCSYKAWTTKFKYSIEQSMFKISKVIKREEQKKL